MAPPATLPANFSGWDAATSGAPPASLPANFSAWDEAAKPQPDTRPFATRVDDFMGRVGDRLQTTLNPYKLADTISGAIKEVENLKPGDIDTKNFLPNMTRLGHALKQTYSDPANVVGDLATSWLGSEVGDVNLPASAKADIVASPKAAPPSTGGIVNALDHPGVSPWVDMAKAEVMKIPGAHLAQTLYKSAKGFADATPEAEAAQVATPTGPPELWGKRIDQAATPEPAATTPQPNATTTPKRAPSGAALKAKNAKALDQSSALKTIPQQIVDTAVPPTGDTSQLNTFVKAQVDKHLSGGDIASAEDILDTAAKTAGSKWQPADRPRIVPSVQNIRDRIAQTSAAEAQPNRITPDTMDDAGISQEMNQDLERHGWAAEAEARREFIARNSTGVTKAELTGAAEKPVKYTKTPGVSSSGSGGANDDLLEKLNTMLDAAKKAKASPN